jgi:AcrR family transcriptional regulator
MSDSTSERILDAAERLFAVQGFEATSIRDITALAGVNLAAVNYHFQNKDSLIHSVITRRLAMVNDQRLTLLRAVIQEAGNDPPRLDGILDAFARPMMEAAYGPGAVRAWGRLVGRMFSEPGDFMKRVFDDHVQHVAEQFLRAFSSALPGLDRTDLLWRIQFLVGALFHVLASGELIEAFSRGACRPADIEATLRQFQSFAQGGLLALTDKGEA